MKMNRLSLLNNNNLIKFQETQKKNLIFSKKTIKMHQRNMKKKIKKIKIYQNYYKNTVMKTDNKNNK